MRKKSTAGRLPWAVAAIVVMAVAAGLGWQLSAPVAPAWRTAATYRSDELPTAHAWVDPAVSGFENIYFIQHGSGNLYQHFKTQGDVWVNANNTNSVEEGPADLDSPHVTLPYETLFDIVIAFKMTAPNSTAYVRKENAKAELGVSGDFTYLENSTDLMEFVFENSNYGTTSGYIRVNARFDNDGNGWKLRAGASISYTATLWGWK